MGLGRHGSDSDLDIGLGAAFGGGMQLLMGGHGEGSEGFGLHTFESGSDVGSDFEAFGINVEKYVSLLVSI